MSWFVAPIDKGNAYTMRAADALLLRCGLVRDENLDYTCGAFDDDGTLCATGSLFLNTLRCLAVDDDHRGEGLMNLIVSHLTEVEAMRGNTHLFLYTKAENAAIFRDLSFSEIVRTGRTVFMENRRNGFENWLRSLKKAPSDPVRTSCVVMNANPFTLGHRFLIEQALSQSDAVHVFVLSENAGPVPANDRFRLVREGTRDLSGVYLHETGPYLISAATFPGYFFRDAAAKCSEQASLDAAIFIRIARELGIRKRFVGSEPSSLVTREYNRVLASLLPSAGIGYAEVPRYEINGEPVSAGRVRRAVRENDLDTVTFLVPETTLRYLTSPEGEKTISAIQALKDTEHH